MFDDNPLKTVDKYPTRTGLIVMIDLLGAKEMTLSESKNFLNKRDKMISEISSVYRKSIANSFVESMDIVEERLIEKRLFKEPEFSLFGDTILIHFEKPDNILETEFFGIYLLWITAIIPIGIELDLPFRGAVAYGEYIADESSNTILGPALNDAANWYEKTDWMGLITTPRTSLLIEFSEENKNDHAKYYYDKYEIPLKEGDFRTIHCVRWANYLVYKWHIHQGAVHCMEWKDDGAVFDLERMYHDEKLLIHDIQEIRAYIIGKLSKGIIPFGTENKYFNTLKYFDYSIDKIKNDLKMQK